MLKAAKQMVPSILSLRQAGHQVLLTHGNGPQVGELALERAAATFDVLGAESMGQIGYILAQVVVDQYSDAFKDPTKYVGPIYGSVEAQAMA